MGEEVPVGCPAGWGTLRVQSEPGRGAEGRSTPKSGPLEQLRETGKVEEEVEE